MAFVALILALLLAPLFAGITNQTKAWFAGRHGPGLFRLYFDLAKLLGKSCPRSATSSWLFDLAPAITLAATLAAAAFFPWTLKSSACARVSPVLFFYLLGTGRFFTILGALDTGSAFAGMGASREAHFSALVEPIVFIVLGFLTLLAQDATLAGCLLHGFAAWEHHAVSILLIGIAFLAILLSECCRGPFDDPETHLELTMIHEAMILDNAGADLAFIHYAAAVKFELLAAFLTALLLPPLGLPPLGGFALLMGGVTATAVLVGVIESSMARMRFLRTPQTLLTVLLLAALGTLLFVMF